MNRLILILCCLTVLFPSGLSAQNNREDSLTVVFRFITDREIFYYEGNGEALDSLCRLVNPEYLEVGAVRVSGYSRTKALSKIRCNRVKSELIIRRGLHEKHFTTQSLTGTFKGHRNVVVVTLSLTRNSLQNNSIKPAETEEQEVEPTVIAIVAEKPYIMSLRTNLLRWATLTPDLGLEWRINSVFDKLSTISEHKLYNQIS